MHLIALSKIWGEVQTACRGETNGVKKDGLNFEWNKPFQTLLEVGLDKLIPQIEKQDKSKNFWPTDLHLHNSQESV